MNFLDNLPVSDKREYVEDGDIGICYHWPFEIIKYLFNNYFAYIVSADN